MFARVSYTYNFIVVDDSGHGLGVCSRFRSNRLWNNYIMQSKNSTSGVQLKPSHSSFSKNDHYDSTMQEEAIKFDETASESGSQKLYIAGLLEDEKKFDETASESGSQKLYVAGLLEDEKWHKEISFNWVKEFSYPQESLEAQLLA